MVSMARMITCECGYQARGKDDSEVLDATMTHISSVHPDRVGVFSPKDLLSMAGSVD
jgi:Protein of unknown function (DUF1059)